MRATLCARICECGWRRNLWSLKGGLVLYAPYLPFSFKEKIWRGLIRIRRQKAARTLCGRRIVNIKYVVLVFVVCTFNVFLLWIVLIPASSCRILSEHCYSWNLIVSAGMSMLDKIVQFFISALQISFCKWISPFFTKSPLSSAT